jgi:hypothetical protein
MGASLPLEETGNSRDPLSAGFWVREGIAEEKIQSHASSVDSGWQVWYVRHR